MLIFQISTNFHTYYCGLFSKKRILAQYFMDLPVGAEACDPSAPCSRLVETLHSCYRRFIWMDDSKEPRRARAGSLIASAEAAEIVEQNKRMNNPSNEQRTQAGHRDHLSTALTRRSRRRSAEYTPCWKRLITI